MAEEGEGKETRGFGEDVELRCGAGDAADEGDGERVEKVGVDSDGEMRRRPWRDVDPDEGSMQAGAGSRVLRRRARVWDASAGGRGERGRRRRRSGRGDLEWESGGRGAVGKGRRHSRSRLTSHKYDGKLLEDDSLQ